MSTVTIDGSHGSLLVHRDTGAVLRTIYGCNCGECAGGYPDILLFNPADMAAWPEAGSFDILKVGYWDDAGRYEPATTIRRIWNDHCGWDFDAVTEMALLPAPAEPGTLIIVHAWQWDGESQSYADATLDKVDGWCAYVRIPKAVDGEFTVIELGDFENRELAIDAANQEAAARRLNPIAAVCVED